MKVYVRCERCSKEGEPTWLSGAYGQMQITAGSWSLPIGWNEIDRRVLCGDCMPIVRAAIDASVSSRILRPPDSKP